MLLYHQQLTEATLRDLAALLVEEGLLATDMAGSAVAAEVERLATRYGKHVA